MELVDCSCMSLFRCFRWLFGFSSLNLLWGEFDERIIGLLHVKIVHVMAVLFSFGILSFGCII